jgi:hypothetical protein
VKKLRTMLQSREASSCRVIDLAARRNEIIRKKLEELALERLHATANDYEPWSFLVRNDGAVSFTYCPWSVTEDWEFDGDAENLSLAWSRSRMRLINRGGYPNKKELCEWRQAKCRQLAADPDWCWIAWIVPVEFEYKVAGYALFMVPSYTGPGHGPILAGIFHSFDKAKTSLMARGAVAD